MKTWWYPEVIAEGMTKQGIPPPDLQQWQSFFSRKTSRNIENRERSIAGWIIQCRIHNLAFFDCTGGGFNAVVYQSVMSPAISDMNASGLLWPGDGSQGCASPNQRWRILRFGLGSTSP